MSRYTMRPLQDATEFTAMLRFTARMAVQQMPFHVCLPGDLAWWRSATPDDSNLAHIRLWFRDDTMVGWAWRNGEQVDAVYDTCEPAVWTQMVAHFAAEYASINMWVHDKLKHRADVLREHGFTPQSETLNLNIQATQTAPQYDMPVGWQVTPMTLADTNSRVTAQHSAFQSTKMTSTRYEFMRNHPGYTPQWDMIAKNSRGDVDAFCTVWVDELSGFALFEPVGCRQEHHRKGITRGLISATLRQLARAGVPMACVLSDGRADNPAQFLYESCGFTWIDRLRMWQRAGS